MRELASIWTHRHLLTSLARHDLRKPYAGTAAGVAWAVLAPLGPLLVFTAVFSLGLRLPLGGAPYVFGFAAAYIPWVLLTSTVTGAAGSILDHRHLVKRVVFPLEIIPIDPLIVHSVPHVILVAMSVLACFIAGYGHFPEIVLLLYFYACAAALAIGASVLLAGLTVVTRDVQQMLPSCLNVCFWLTPIAWAGSQLPPGGRRLLALNPASYVVSGYRYALMPTVFPPPGIVETSVFWTITLVLLVASTAAFRRLRPHFWDCL